MTQLLKNNRDLLNKAKKLHNDYFGKLKNNGGYSLYISRLGALILWGTFGLNIASRLSPVKEFFSSFTTLAIIIILLNLLTNYTKDLIPPMVGYILSGKFIVESNLTYVNRWILTLLILNSLMLLISVDTFNKIKKIFTQNGYK